MSLLNPDARDRFDAYGYPEHNGMYLDQLGVMAVKWRFESVPGFFHQSDETTDDMEFRYVKEDFGVKGSWKEVMERLASVRSSLSSSLPSSLPSTDQTKYKLLFLARHGEGYHNVANAKYRDQWASKYRFIGTDGVITWGPDAKLTDLGKAQAGENNLFLKQQVAKGMPIPTKFIVSPLLRSIETMVLEWDGIDIPRPIVNEKVRETIGINICHQRATKTELTNFPIDFPPDFPEQDEIFHGFTSREEYYQQFLRINDFLQELFEEDDEVVSITCHAGSIRAFLTVIGHRGFTIPTGGMIPVVVKASASTRSQ